MWCDVQVNALICYSRPHVVGVIYVHLACIYTWLLMWSSAIWLWSDGEMCVKWIMNGNYCLRYPVSNLYCIFLPQKMLGRMPGTNWEELKAQISLACIYTWQLWCIELSHIISLLTGRFYTSFSTCSASQYRLIHKVEQNDPNDTFRHGFHGCFRSRSVLCSITDKQLKRKVHSCIAQMGLSLFCIIRMSHDML